MKTIDSYFRKPGAAAPIRKSPRKKTAICPGKDPQHPSSPAAPSGSPKSLRHPPPHGAEGPSPKRRNKGSPSKLQSPAKATSQQRAPSPADPSRPAQSHSDAPQPADQEGQGEQQGASIPQDQQQGETPLPQGQQQAASVSQEQQQAASVSQEQQQGPPQNASNVPTKPAAPFFLGQRKQEAPGSSSTSEPQLSTSEQDAQRLAQAGQLVAAARREQRPLQLGSLLLDDSWKRALAGEMGKQYFKDLQGFLHKEWAGSLPIYPPPEMVFRALNSCPLDKVRVVIIGQDPYHGPNQGMGLCFSVNKGIRVPPSLVNIFKELNSDLGCQIPSHGDLTKWSHQGVLLLNTVMTVRQGQANSHKSKGWEKFTDACISQLSQRRKGIVFLLWGKPAQAKEKLIPAARHHVLKCPHPSPLASASGPGFSGCRHFSQANNLLVKSGLPPVDWSLE